MGVSKHLVQVKFLTDPAQSAAITRLAEQRGLGRGEAMRALVALATGVPDGVVSQPHRADSLAKFNRKRAAEIAKRNAAK
jgi:hypothetical protein